MAIVRKRQIENLEQMSGEQLEAFLDLMPARQESVSQMLDYVEDEPYDPEAARKMLDEAGVKDLSMEIWAMPVQRPYMPNARRAAEMMQSDFAKVGVKVDIVHTRATPVGQRVSCESTLVEVDRRRLVFEVVAHDERGEIGRGRHERFVIDTKKFMEKL